jgi:P4 family phage/plasmid primase-like protien
MDHGERARKIISAADIAAVDVRNGKKASIDHTTQPPEETTGNWGIYAKPDDSTVLIDIDDYPDNKEDLTTEQERGLTAIRGLPDTYTQESPHGGTHRVYKIDTGDGRAVAEHLEDVIGVQNPKPSWGEVRVANQYIVGAGSELSDCGKSWHDCSDPETDSSYRIASDHAVATISIGDLVGALARDAEILSGEQTDSNDIRSYDDDGTDVDVRVSRVVTGYTLGKRDEHPVHGSGTGTNFKIDEDDDTWRCWRHDCTGNAMHMVGMQAGIVDCGDWKQGGLSSEIWADIFEEARNRGIIDDDRRAATAEELAGSGEHEKGDLDDDEDSSKSTKSLAEALTDDEWTDYLERADITDAVVKVPNPDYDENEDDVDDKYTEEYRSARQIVRNGGVGDDEEIVAVYTNDDLRLGRTQVKVEIREDPESMVRRRLNARDVRYVADYEAAQKLITRIQSAYRTDGPEHEARHLTADYVDRVMDIVTIPEEDDRIWLYNAETGAWDPQGETVIASICEEAMGPQWRTVVRREVLGKLRDRHRETAETAWNPRATVPDDVVPVKNGLIKLPTKKTGRAGQGPELIDHTPDARSKHSLPVNFDADQSSQAWREFALEITGDRDPYADLLEEIIGQILLSDNRNPCLPILHGPGSNGKGVLERVLNEFAGGSASSVSLDKLEENRFAAATLVGNMVNIVPDLDATRLSSINVTKSITGNDPIEIEPKGGNSYHVRPRTTLIYGANRPPILPENNNAIKRRLLPIPLPIEFVPDPDPDNPTEQPRVRNREQELLTEEALSGLLNAALAGLERYEETGAWSHPLNREERVAQYTKKSDAIVAACDDLIVECAGERVPKAAIYDAYTTYAREKGRSPVQPSTFWKRYGKTSLPSRTGRPTAPGGDGRERVVHGVALTADAYKRLSEEWRSHEWVVDGCQAAGEFDSQESSNSSVDDKKEAAADGGGQTDETDIKTEDIETGSIKGQVLEHLRVSTESGDHVTAPAVAGEIGESPDDVADALQKLAQNLNILQKDGGGTYKLL